MGMAFRADEAAEIEFERAKRYLISREWSERERAESLDCLRELTIKYGPVVAAYPTWHPLVRNHDPSLPEVRPNERTGFSGLDHTVCFVNAFLTCPYSASDNVSKLKTSMKSFEQHHTAYVSIEELDVHFYSLKAKPLLVECNWSDDLETNEQIPRKFAVPLMIENEMKIWGSTQLAERWDTMRPYLLGEPHGARSSLFVSQNTGMAIKRTYMELVESGMFGPLRMG